jgi:HEAT repeat protein
MLIDESLQVRKMAAYSLGIIKDPRAISPLIYTIGGKCAMAKKEDSSFFYKSENDLIHPMLYPFGMEYSEVVENAMWSLVQMGDIVVEPVITALNTDNFIVRRNAARILDSIGNKRSIDPLIKLLDDDNDTVVENAKWALLNLGCNDVKRKCPMCLNDVSISDKYCPRCSTTLK